MKFFIRVFFSTLILALVFAVMSKTLPPRGVIPVLAYHSIGTRQDSRELKNFVSRQSFSWQMAFLNYFGYRVISMKDYEAIIKGDQKPRGREIVLTFDDANQTFEQEVYPVLKRYSFPAALFVVSESMKRQINASLSEESLKEILESGLITLGSASKTHPFFPALTYGQLQSETQDSKKDLEQMSGKEVHYFAYPNGDLNARAVAAVKKAGYQLAFTTSHHKLKGLQESPYALTRLKISRSADHFLIYWVKVTGVYQIHKAKWQQIKSWFSASSGPRA